MAWLVYSCFFPAGCSSHLVRPVDESGDIPASRIPCVEQLLQHPGVLLSIVSVVGLSQEVADQVPLRVTAQTSVDILAQQEGVQKPGHHLLELLQEVELLQHSDEHRCIEQPCIVGRQQHGATEGAEEGDEGGEGIRDGDGAHWSPTDKQLAIFDGTACDLCGTAWDGAAGEGVGIEDTVSTDGRQLDEVTHTSVWRQNDID